MNIRTTHKTKNVLLALIGLLILDSPLVHAGVVVIPLEAELASIKNVITVSEKGGDFTNIVDALNSVEDRRDDGVTANDRYLVVVGPGTYFPKETLHIKSYVHLTGAGIKKTEIVAIVDNKFTFPFPQHSSAVFLLSNYSSISNMSVTATDTRNEPMSLFVSEEFQNDTRISNIEALISGSNMIEGVVANSDTIVKDSVFTLSPGSGLAYGARGGVNGLPTGNQYINSKFSFIDCGAARCTGISESYGFGIETTLVSNTDIEFLNFTSSATPQTALHASIGGNVFVRNSLIKGGVISESPVDDSRSKIIITNSVLTGSASGDASYACFSTNDLEQDLTTDCSVPE